MRWLRNLLVAVLLAAVVAALAVVLGALLALAPRTSEHWFGPIRTFALTASLAVVLTHLVPEGFAALGVTALVVFGAGALLPPTLETLVSRLWRHRQAGSQRSLVGLEAGYAGLLVHKLGDGVGLGAYAGPMGGGQPQLDVMVALAAHTVPVVAVVMLAFESARGRRAAVERAAGIAVATLAGVFVAGLVPAELVHHASAWIAAAVSGLLLHVVMHDLATHPPRSAGERSLDLGAALLGLAVPLVGGHAAEGDAAGSVSRDLARSLWDLTLDTAPMLLVGLMAGALIQSFGSRIPERWLRSRGILVDAVRGAVVGAPLPLCSCSVLPVSGALAPRAGPALVVAFLLATPELGVETFALSVRFLGWHLATLRLLGALLVAIVAGVVIGRLTRRERAEPVAAAGPEPSAPRRSLADVARAFDELLHHIGAWMVVGLCAAAAVETLIPADALGAMGHPLLELAVVSAVAIPSYVCAPSATPLAAVLIAKGLSPGAVLVGLLLGPATNLATLAFLRRSYGTRATALGILAVVGLSWLLALGTNHWLPVVEVHAHAVVEHEAHGVLALAAGGLLVLLLVRSIWRSGTRLWLASLSELGSGHAHDHGHGHGRCEHDHRAHDVNGA